MPHTELTKEQIQELYLFVEERNVPYIDVQHEIVDHLASAVEDEMDSIEGLSFKSALHRVYGRFPITGFAVLIMEKEKSLLAYWQRKKTKLLLDYFSPSRVLIILSIYITACNVIYHLDALGMAISYTALVIFTVVTIIIRKKRKQNLEEKNLLLMQTYNRVVTIKDSIVIYLYFYYLDIGSIDFNLFWSLLASGLIMVLGLLIHTKTFVFPKLLQEEIKTKYAHLDLDYT